MQFTSKLCKCKMVNKKKIRTNNVAMEEPLYKCADCKYSQLPLEGASSLSTCRA